MKILLAAVLMIGVVFTVGAEDQITAVEIQNHQLGSGSPGLGVAEQAVQIEGEMFHAPQYMPDYPTARVLWPRVVHVDCKRSVSRTSMLTCDGYNWLPELGRGEYLFFIPNIVKAPEPVISYVNVPGPERVIEKLVIVPGAERVIEKVKIVKVPGPVQVVPGQDRVIEKNVPGPERIIEKLKIVPGPERIVEKLVNVPIQERVIIREVTPKKNKE